MTEKKPLGILFVHGIGNQGKGSTLLDFSEPIYEWIERWTKEGDKTNKSGVEILDVDLYPSDDSPAHTEWQVHITQKDGALKKEKWLLAEAWWAEAFAAPGFSLPIWWTVRIGPWMIFSHFFTLFRRIINKDRPNYLWWLFVAFFSFIIYIPLALLLMPLFQIVALFLLTLSYIQISSIQSVIISPVQFFISNWIGDSYFLTTSPIRRAGMINKVKRELQWLEEKCSKVVIVAHSQGAAIMHEVLQQHPSDSGRFLITLGSGLRLLSTVKNISGDPFFQFISVVSLLIPVAFIFFLLKPESWLFMLLLLFVFLGLLVVGDKIRPISPIKTDKEKFGTGFQWLDLYASRDPASNGELFERMENRPDFLQSREVYNLSNMFMDHSTYWQNRDEFVTAVVTAISEFSGLNLTNLTETDADIISHAKERRRTRVNWLGVAGLAAMGFAVLIILLFYFRIVSSIVSNEIKEWVIQYLNGIESLQEVLPNLPGGWMASLIETIALLCLPLFWYSLTKWVWNQWDRFETDRFFGRQYVRGNRFLNLFLMVMMAGIIAVVVLLFPSSRFADLVSRAATFLVKVIGFAIVTFFTSYFIVLWTSFLIVRFRSVSDHKKLILAIYAGLLIGALYAVRINGISPVYQYLGGWGFIVIPILVVLYDRFLAPRLDILSRVRSWQEKLNFRSRPAPSGSAKAYVSRFSSTWRRYVVFLVGAALAIWTCLFHLDLRSPVIMFLSMFALGPFIGWTFSALEGKDKDYISKAIAIIGITLVIIITCMALYINVIPE